MIKGAPRNFRDFLMEGRGGGDVGGAASADGGWPAWLAEAEPCRPVAS